MLEEMLDRWKDMGRPLFMVPKDFRDRILLNIDSEVKLNYLKWLTHSLDIDIFEIMSMLIIYSRCSLNKRMMLLFQLYCYNKFGVMDPSEVKFMLSKLSCGIATTLQIKKSQLIELNNEVHQIMFYSKSRVKGEFGNISEGEFAQKMT